MINTGDYVLYTINATVKVGKAVRVEKETRKWIVVPLGGGKKVLRSSGELFKFTEYARLIDKDIRESL
jgi:uncharacterized protein YgiM (DUF1202 family)